MRMVGRVDIEVLALAMEARVVGGGGEALILHRRHRLLNLRASSIILY